MGWGRVGGGGGAAAGRRGSSAELATSLLSRLVDCGWATSSCLLLLCLPLQLLQGEPDRVVHSKHLCPSPAQRPIFSFPCLFGTATSKNYDGARAYG